MKGVSLSVTFIIFILLTGCSNLNRTFSNFFFPPNSNSDIRANEQTTIIIESVEDRETIKNRFDGIFNSKKFTPTGDEAPPAGFLPPLAAPAVAGFVIDQVESFLKKEAERYTAAYSAVITDDVFYDGPNELAKINIKGFKFSRKAGNDSQTAMQLCAAVRPTVDQRAFEIFIKKPDIFKSKAKLIAFDFLAPLGFDLLAPWTILKTDGKWTSYDNDVDITAQVFFYGVWIDSKGSPHTEQMVSKEVTFRNVELQNTSGAQSACEYDSIKSDAKDNPEGYKQLLFNAIPRNYLGKFSGPDREESVFGAGNYILAVLITENDDFGENVRELGDKIKENRDDIINRLTEGL